MKKWNAPEIEDLCIEMTAHGNGNGKNNGKGHGYDDGPGMGPGKGNGYGHNKNKGQLVTEPPVVPYEDPTEGLS